MCLNTSISTYFEFPVFNVVTMPVKRTTNIGGTYLLLMTTAFSSLCNILPVFESLSKLSLTQLDVIHFHLYEKFHLY